MQEEREETFVTVGQLARKMGVTIRTIQYYDQQGLLTPSAKGQNNQRLYSPADEEALQRILVLKYLGLSLADIRKNQDALSDSDAFRKQLSRTLAALEDDFEALIKRLSTLRAMLAQTEESDTINWAHAAQLIDDDQPKGSYFWRAAETVDALPPEPQESRARGIAVGTWHELIADTISLISEQVPTRDPRAQALAQRYLDLQSAQQGSLEDSFLLMENISPHGGQSGSFNVLRQSVSAYLDKAAAKLKEDQTA